MCCTEDLFTHMIWAYFKLWIFPLKLTHSLEMFKVTSTHKNFEIHVHEMIHKNLEKFRITCKNLETPLHEMINKKLEKFQMTQKKCEKHVSVYALQTVSQTFAQCCL